MDITNNENKEEKQQIDEETPQHESASSHSLGIPGAIVLGSALIAAAMYFGMANLGGDGLPSFGSGDPGGLSATVPAPSGTPSAPTQPASGPVDMTAGDLPTLGDPDAPVLVVEWSDYTCPFCGRLFRDVLPELKTQYIDTGKVRFAYRDFAFKGQEATDAANAARCANDQGKFWEFHDQVFISKEARITLSKDALKGLAADLGVNASQFNDCVDNDTHVDAVNADMAVGRAAGVSGTPTTFINGRVVNGAQPFAAFETVIEDELAK